MEDKTTSHIFVKRKTPYECNFCQNNWPSSSIISANCFYCELCHIAVHSECKILAIRCIPCNQLKKQRIIFPEFLSGKIRLKLKHAYDIPVPTGMLLYGIWKFEEKQYARTDTSLTTTNECVWSDETQEIQLSQIRCLKESHYRIQLEIWKSFFDFFDKLLFKTSIDIAPLLSHPNLILERWFVIELSNISELEQTNIPGKVLIEMEFLPDFELKFENNNVEESTDVKDEISFSEDLENEISMTTPVSEVQDLNHSKSNSNSSSNKKIALDEIFSREVERESISNLEHSFENSTSSTPYKQISIHSDVSSDISNEQQISTTTTTATAILPLSPQLEVISSESIIQSENKSTPTIKQLQITPLMNEKVHVEPNHQSTFFESFEKALTSLGNTIFELESQSDSYIADSNKKETPKKLQSLNSTKQDFKTFNNCVGWLHLHVISAHNNEVTNEAGCEYFLECHLIDSSQKYYSHTIAHSSSPIFNVKYTFNVPHYKSFIEIRLMDAITRSKIGFARLNAYEIIQRNADYKISSFVTSPMRKILIKDFNNPNKNVGYFEIATSFVFEMDKYFWSPKVQYLPSVPEEELSVERLNQHIARFREVINWFSECYQEYLYIMDWKEPILTSSLFLLFLYCTLYIKAEYSLSGFFFGLVILMTRTMIRRKNGEYKKHYISKGYKEPKYDYLPIATLRFSILGFKFHPKSQFFSKFLSSTDGFHQMKSCPITKITYHPKQPNNQTPSEKGIKDFIIGYLGSAEQIQITSINEQTLGVSNLLSNFLKSEGENKYDWMLHNLVDPWPCESILLQDEMKSLNFIKNASSDISLLYPISQPLKSHFLDSSINIDDNYDMKTRFLPWDQNDSHIQLEIHQESSSTFLEGEVQFASIPIKDFIRYGTQISPGYYELKRWYKTVNRNSSVQKNNSLSDIDNISFDAKNPLQSNSMDWNHLLNTDNSEASEVFVRAAIKLPDERKTLAPSNKEIKESIMLQEIHSGKIFRESSTFEVLWNMRDNIKYVQNLMNNILDSIESFKNIFNWTSPSKTWPLYCCLVFIWLITIFVPGRIIILLIGLYEFMYIFLPIPEGNEIIIRFCNFLQFIPNDDDLDTIYANEKSNFRSEKLKEKEAMRRKVLLNIVLPLLWSGKVTLKVNRGKMIGHDWLEYHLVLQGKRLLWWSSSKDMEAGKIPVDQMLLSTLSAITQVSPIDARKHENSLLLAIFGQDSLGKPMKLSLCFDKKDSRDEFKLLVEEIILSKS